MHIQSTFFVSLLFLREGWKEVKRMHQVFVWSLIFFGTTVVWFSKKRLNTCMSVWPNKAFTAPFQVQLHTPVFMSLDFLMTSFRIYVLLPQDIIYIYIYIYTREIVINQVMDGPDHRLFNAWAMSYSIGFLCINIMSLSFWIFRVQIFHGNEDLQ